MRVLVAIGIAVRLLAQAANPNALEEANRGLALAKQNKYSEAVQAYKHALAIDPSIPGLYLNLGLAWFKLGNFRQALDAFQKEGARSPDARVKTLVAMSEFGLKQYREAAAHLEPLAAEAPGNSELSYLLAKCYMWSGQLQKAMDLFQQLLQRDPDSPTVHMLIGEALDAQRRTADAIPEFEAAAKLAPTQPDLHFGLGYLYWEQKRYEDAEREFRQELQNNPDSAEANAYLGDTLMKTGKNQQAIEYLKKAIALNDKLHIAHQDLAILYAQTNQNERAVSEFREAIKSDPSNYDAHYRLARLYQKLGQAAEANKEFAIVQRLHEKITEEPLMNISGPR